MAAKKTTKKAPKPVKDAAARQREAEIILVQLQDLGFPDVELARPAALLRAFAEQGVGATETFRYDGFGVEVLVQLSTQPHVTSFARVRRLTTQRGC